MHATRKSDSTVEWRKSSASGPTNDCVEVAIGQGQLVSVRDSKDQTGPVLTFTTAAWQAFVEGLHNGKFNPQP